MVLPIFKMGKKLDAAKQEIAALGWTLLDNEYTNLDTILNLQCPEGHNLQLTLRQWRKNPNCSICEHSSRIEQKKKNTNRIIALDNATRVTGWAIFDDEKLVSYGKYTTKSGETSDRILEVGDWLTNLLEQWEPNTIILEDIQQQNNVSTFKVLAKLQGVLEYINKKNNIEYYIISPSTWKSNAGVKGKTRVDQKKSAQLIVQQLYNIQTTQDESDAILLGKYGVDKFLKNNRMVNFES